MSKNLPEAIVMSSNPDSPLSLDEPDFSGLLALTEASIRQKLSELKYPDSDVSSSQKNDDSDQKIISDAKNQLIIVNQSIPKTDSETQETSFQEMATEPSSSSITHIDRQISDGISNIEQPKITVPGTEYIVNTNVMKLGDDTGAGNVMSALDDPLANFHSLKSKKPESEEEQKVKYCGLSLELPKENKSPEIRKIPEKINNYPKSPSGTSGVECTESSEKEMYVLEIHDDDDDDGSEQENTNEIKKDTIENDNPVSCQPEVNDKDINGTSKTETPVIEEVEKNCGLHEIITDNLPQSKNAPTHTAQSPESLEQESVVQESDFEHQSVRSKGLTKDEPSQNSVQKSQFSFNDDISDKGIHNVHNEKRAKEANESVIGVVLGDTGAGKTITSDEPISSEIPRSELSGVCQTRDENQVLKEKDRLDKAVALPTAETVLKENLMAKQADLEENLTVESEHRETDNIVPEDIGVDVDKSLAETAVAPGVGGDVQQKADNGDEVADISENELGLVISGVCSTSEVMEESDTEMIQVHNGTSDDHQNEIGKQESRESREESGPIQEDPEVSLQPACDDLYLKPTGDDLHREPAGDDLHREPADDDLHQEFAGDDLHRKPAGDELHIEVAEDVESELMDISDDIVLIDINNHKSESDNNIKSDSNAKAPLSVSGVICPDINLKITDSSDSIRGLDSDNANSDNEVAQIRAEKLTETPVNALVKPINTTDSETTSFSNDKNEENILDLVKELNTKQVSSESNRNVISSITIANVVSLDQSRIQDAAMLSQTNTELSALESMLKKVTQRGSEKVIESNVTINTDSLDVNALNSNSASKDKQTESTTDKTDDGPPTNKTDQVASSVPGKEVETTANTSDTCDSKQRSDQTKGQSTSDSIKINLSEQTDGALTVQDTTDLTPISVSQSTKTGELPVKENNSLTEVGEMLMITNVRTISIDEDERLAEDITKDKQIPPALDALSDKERSTASNKDNISGHKTTVLNEETGTFELVPATLSSSANACPEAVKRNTPLSVRSDPSSVPVPVSLNTGMPVIANTFTIKEEPIDYEPYGMSDTMASSRDKQAMSTQSRNGCVASERLGMQGDVAMKMANSLAMKQANSHLWNQSRGEQAHHGKIIAKPETMVSAYAPSTTDHIRKPSRISSGEVNSYAQAIQKTTNDAFHHQKAPVTVPRPAANNAGRPAASKVPSYMVNGKSKAQPSIASKPLVSGKSQVFTQHSNGTVAQIQRSHYPSVVNSLAKPAPAPVPVQPQPPPPKFAMNLKTINIETVGIPMITEMIARKNPVPVYKPPPPPKSVLGDEKTRQTFQCYECGDTFYFTSSLEQHTYRCSMKISYKCEWCRKILEFTNKCQLLSHLRSHMNIDKNQAVPIHIKSDSIEIRTNFDDIIPGKEFRWYDIPEKENLDDVTDAQFLINTTNNGRPSQIIRLCRAHECTECKLTFYKKDDRAKMIHFAPDKNVKPIFCGKCPMYLHNHCGIKAHRRLHEDIMKLDFLVCPECGICYEGKPQSIPVFLKHLKTKCFHLSRFSTMHCKKCNSNCTGVEELRHHLMTQVEQYYKCNKCPMALKTLKSFKTHFKQVHEEKTNKDDSVHEAKAKIIYRCHVCDTLIDDKEFLLSHIEKHLSELKDQAKEYYHCLQCGLIFFEHKSLASHYKTHRQAASETFCTLCRTQRRDMVEFTQHILAQHIAPVFKPQAKICEECGLVCVDEHKLRIHECHMKTFAFVVQGDKSAAALQKDHKIKSPRKEAKEQESREEKDKVADRQEDPNDDDSEILKVADKDDVHNKLGDKGSKNNKLNVVDKYSKHKASSDKKSPVKSENSTGKYRPIQPKPLREEDAIPLQYETQCPYCGDPYSSNFRRVEHLRNHKIDKVFICPYCEDSNFETNDELEHHELDCSKKTNWDCHDPIPKHLSKRCPSCKYVYGGKSKRHYHIKAHRGDKVFICLYCDAMNFTNYPELRSHEVVCSALNKTTVKSTDKSPTRNKIKLKISKGKPSKTSSPDQPTQYNVEYKCDECGECFSRKEKQEEHTRLEHGIHPCHLCGLMYESQTSLKKHLLISHEGKKCVYYCWVCKRRRKFFSDVSNLHKHFTMKHKYRVWDPAKAVAELPGMATQDSNKPPQPVKRRIETSPEIPDTPVKKLRIMSDKGFKCAKCSFVSEERKDFQAHIKEHKMDGSVQCIECGLSFMVIPSLKKHLFMVHKVKDFDTYLKEHNMEDLQEPEDTDSENESDKSRSSESLIVDEPIKDEDPEPESDEEEGNPLECKVCYKKFETEHLMKSHMRVHGMAFIKKTRRSLSSTAKKQKLDSSEDQNEPEREKSVEKHANAS